MVGKVQTLAGSPFQQHGGPKQLQSLPVQLAHVGAIPGRLVDYSQAGRGIAHQQAFYQLQPAVSVSQSQQFLYLVQSRAFAVGQD